MPQQVIDRPPKRRTIADLWEQLDEIPLDRILLTPAPGTATERHLLTLLDSDDKQLCELIDGVLVEKPMGQLESRIAGLIVYFLHCFLEQNDLGIVLVPDGPLRLASGLVRMPDVSFLSWSHFPDRQIGKDAILNHAPDLAVEVLSQSNTAKEMKRKLKEYFAAGTRLVWYIDPLALQATRYANADQGTNHGLDQPLDGAPVLPGFTLSLREVFARAGMLQKE
jgi:Uma2 family endonuclease